MATEGSKEEVSGGGKGALTKESFEYFQVLGEGAFGVVGQIFSLFMTRIIETDTCTHRDTH
jgi:hypothetical protein